MSAPQASPAGVAPTPSSAEAILRTPGVTLVDYPVRGTTYAEITKDLDLFSTGGAGGAKSDFGFSWVLSWNYTTDPITNQPEVKVAPRFNVELPRWTNFESASAKDKELWANYRALLLRGIEARILLVQAFVPRAESDIQNFVVRNPKAKQIEIDDVLNSTIRVLQTRLKALQSTEASDFPRKPLLAIGAP
jgi:predicted secreted Zn-dependent protease